MLLYLYSEIYVLSKRIVVIIKEIIFCACTIKIYMLQYKSENGRKGLWEFFVKYNR